MRACFARQPPLSPKWFHGRSSRLFDAICGCPVLPDPHRARAAGPASPEIARRITRAPSWSVRRRQPAQVRLLLDALERPASLLPIDISAEHL
jgi:uncharacterized SAM-dependent methyltransferase